MNILALESSTTSAKAMLYDTQTHQYVVESIPYILKHKDITQHDGEDVYQSMISLGKKISAGIDVDIIALSGVWHSIMLCNDNMQPQSPVYLWSYTGANKVCRKLRTNQDYVNNFYQTTGCMVNSIYPIFKIIHLQELGYDLTKYRFIGQGTYNNFRLTNQWVVSQSIASGTGLMNIHTKQYDQHILKDIGINETQLGTIIPYTQTYSLTEKAAQSLGLKSGIPVIITNSDGGLNQIGSGATKPGVMTFSVGTSGALRLSVEKPVLPSRASTWNYFSPKGYMSGAATSGCCNCIDWFKLTQCQNKFSYSELEQGIHSIEDTPVFLPFLFGERCPGWKDDVTAAFLNIKPIHTLFDQYRAVQEGVLFNLYQCYLELTELHGIPNKVLVSGGILKSKLWTQMCADIFGCEITIDTATHSSLMGCIALSLEVLGIIDDAADFEIHHTESIFPNLELKNMYNQKYQTYLQWYKKLGE